MKGLSYSQMCEIAEYSTSRHEMFLESVSKCRRFSPRGYFIYIQSRRSVLLLQAFLFLVGTAAGTLHLLGVVASFAYVIFVFMCIIPFVAVPIVGAVLLDVKIRISSRRLRSGICPVCEYPLCSVDGGRIADAVARNIICSECGTPTIVPCTD